MNVKTAGEIRYYQFSSLEHVGVVQGIFGRGGGVSTEPYASLNVSLSTGDAVENVRENRIRAFRAVERDPASIADVRQIHSAEVVVAEAPKGERENLGHADALVTNRPEVTLFMRFADCVPVLLFDPQRRVAGLAHAGWRGTLLKTPVVAVRAMMEQYGSRPEDILAGIGPSIGPCHYEVGPEVVEQTRAAFPDSADDLLAPAGGGHHHLNLWAANARALREIGVEQIEIGSLCTACHADEFFSHRAEHGQTGRFGAIIGLR